MLFRTFDLFMLGDPVIQRSGQKFAVTCRASIGCHDGGTPSTFYLFDNAVWSAEPVHRIDSTYHFESEEAARAVLDRAMSENIMARVVPNEVLLSRLQKQAWRL